MDSFEITLPGSVCRCAEPSTERWLRHVYTWPTQKLSRTRILVLPRTRTLTLEHSNTHLCPTCCLPVVSQNSIHSTVLDFWNGLKVLRLIGAMVEFRPNTEASIFNCVFDLCLRGKIDCCCYGPSEIRQKTIVFQNPERHKSAESARPKHFVPGDMEIFVLFWC